ncbi:MAG: hypothetical protein LQ338_003731 [Usnochroma carphineum]|nr:MAG: hypothetical protein LQ338_003731 [Usnochroma carphineum]
MPGTGIPIDVRMNASIQAVKTVARDEKEVYFFLNWFAYLCRTNSYTDVVAKLFDPLKNVADSVVPTLGSKTIEGKEKLSLRGGRGDGGAGRKGGASGRSVPKKGEKKDQPPVAKKPSPTPKAVHKPTQTPTAGEQGRQVSKNTIKGAQLSTRKNLARKTDEAYKTYNFKGSANQPNRSQSTEHNSIFIDVDEVLKVDSRSILSTGLPVSTQPPLSIDPSVAVTTRLHNLLSAAPSATLAALPSLSTGQPLATKGQPSQISDDNSMAIDRALGAETADSSLLLPARLLPTVTGIVST